MSAKDNTSKEMKYSKDGSFCLSEKVYTPRQSKAVSLVQRYGFNGLNSMIQTNQELLRGWLEVGKDK